MRSAALSGHPGAHERMREAGTAMQKATVSESTLMFLRADKAFDAALATAADNAYAVATGPGLAAVADYSGLIVFRTGVSTGATEPPLPARFDLAAMPNPFNPRTDLAFSLPQAGQVRIDVYDVSGRRLIRLADGEFSAGDHRLPWDGRDECDRPQPSGVYFARMEVNGATGPGLGTAKLILIR